MMLIKSIFILFTNYFLVTTAENGFLKNESKNDGESNQNKSGFNTTSVPFPALRLHEEKADIKHYHGRGRFEPRVFDPLNTDYENELSYEYDNLDRPKRAATVESSIPPSKYIVAGTQSYINAYPWMVFLNIIEMGPRGNSYCGGSLINSKYVVTAAHCVPVKLRSLNDIQVVLAEYDIRTPSRDCVQYSNGKWQCVNNVAMFPEQVIIHRRYNRMLLTNDIALIRLRGHAPNTASIRPIPLPEFDVDDPRNKGVELVVAGWGSMYEGGLGSPVKLEAIVNLVPFPQCRIVAGVPEGKMCAIGKNGQDACHGDSGGPLMADYRGSYYLVGIVSGKSIPAKCGSGVPTTYTNVYQYLGWIKRNMRA